MNIFYFDEDPVEAAKVQPDKMLVKMVLETAQMLSCAHRELDGDSYADMHNLYKSTHKNHPCFFRVEAMELTSLGRILQLKS